MGRDLPLVPAWEIDYSWLKRYVLAWPPELVGAAWDGAVGSPEVAALLARLVAEGKLRSRVQREGRHEAVLFLQLTAPRESFAGAERELIDALFFDGRTATSTTMVAEHYRKRGFDPAGILRPELEERLAALPGPGRVPRPWRLPVALLAIALLLWVAAVVLRPVDGVLAASPPRPCWRRAWLSWPAPPCAAAGWWTSPRPPW